MKPIVKEIKYHFEIVKKNSDDYLNKVNDKELNKWIGRVSKAAEKVSEYLEKRISDK